MSEKFEKGLKVRREVLGDAYVSASLASGEDFGADLQKLVTEYCWGEVWTRPGLPRQTRSLLNIVMLTALNRPHEVRTHLRGAFNNGCTEEEVLEAIVQAAIYCGVPAALDTMRIARDVVAEHREQAA
jgi:4-carboxymuconolactone decarboxylase